MLMLQTSTNDSFINEKHHCTNIFLYSLMCQCVYISVINKSKNTDAYNITFQLLGLNDMRYIKCCGINHKKTSKTSSPSFQIVMISRCRFTFLLFFFLCQFINIFTLSGFIITTTVLFSI